MIPISDASLLCELTPDGARAWIERIQQLIVKHSPDATPEDQHPKTNVGAWMHDLVEDIAKLSEGWDPHKVDENIRGAQVMTMVLLAWTIRVWRSKTQDPRRDVGARRASLQRLLAFQMEVCNLLMNDTDEHTSFPGQDWHHPYRPLR